MAYNVDTTLFRAQFGSHAVPGLLLQLLDFQNEMGPDVFPEGFYLDVVDKTGLRTYSEDPAWTNAFIEFAKANYTGSTYGFWLIHNDLAQCPVVAFGDEGGFRIIAQNLLELLHLTTFNTEIMIGWEQAFFYRDEGESGEEKPLYLQWIRQHAGLEPLTASAETDTIIRAAEGRYQQELKTFARQYGDF